MKIKKEEIKREDIFNIEKYYSRNNKEYLWYKSDQSKYFLNNVELSRINNSKRIIVLDGERTNRKLLIELDFLKHSKEISYLKLENCSVGRMGKDINFKIPNLKVLVMKNCTFQGLKDWEIEVNTIVFINCRFDKGDSINKGYVKNLFVEDCEGCNDNTFQLSTIETLHYRNKNSTVKLATATRLNQFIRKISLWNGYGDVYDNSVIHDLNNTLIELKFTDGYGDFDFYYGLSNCTVLERLTLDVNQLKGLEFIERMTSLKVLDLRVNKGVISEIIDTILDSGLRLKHFRVNGITVMRNGDVVEEGGRTTEVGMFKSYLKAVDVVMNGGLISNSKDKTEGERACSNLQALAGNLSTGMDNPNGELSVIDFSGIQIKEIEMVVKVVDKASLEKVDDRVALKIGLIREYFKSLIR